MYRKKKHNKKILIVIIGIVVIVLLSFSLNLNRNTSFVENIFKDISMVFNKVIMYPFTALNNDKNVNQDESYVIQKNVNASLEKEIRIFKI